MSMGPIPGSLPGSVPGTARGSFAGPEWPARISGAVSASFLILHLGALSYVIVTIPQAWQWRPAIRLVADHFFTPFGLGVVASWIVPLFFLLLLAVVALGCVDALGSLRRLRQGPEPHAAMRFRLALYLLVSCVFFNAFLLSVPQTALGPFRVRLPIVSALSMVAAYGVYAGGSLRLARNSSTQRRWGRRLDLLAMNLVLILVLAEGGLRLIALLRPSPLLVTGSSSIRARRGANREPPGSVRFNFPVNRGGHYDTEFLPAGARTRPTVVTIGDSYSYGTVPHAHHFTTIAEEDLRGIDIYNMGFPDIGPGDYLELLRGEALPLRPQLVIINLFLGNDVTDGAPVQEPARWHDADRYLIAVVWNRLQVMKQARVAQSPDMVREASLSRSELALRYPWLTDPALEQPLFSREIYLNIERRSAAVIASPEGKVWLDRFVARLSELKQSAGTVPLGFMLIPAAFQVEDSIWARIADSTQPLQRDLAQQVVTGWLRCHGYPVLDLLPVLRAVPMLPDGSRHVYHLNDTHFNARGNEITGHALARFIDSLRSAPAGASAAQAPSCGKPVPPTSPAVTLPLYIDLGDSSARPWMVDGWNEDEKGSGTSYVWSEGMQSRLAIRLPDTTGVRMRFEALPFAAGGSRQRVDVVVNGEAVGSVRLGAGMQTYELALSADNLRADVDTLEFRYAYARMPRDVIGGSPDVRRLAVAWYSMTLEPR